MFPPSSLMKTTRALADGFGAVVGEKLWQLARQHQVLCITHLPQLAAYGDEHYCVHKEVTIGRTTTRVSALQGDARLNELALMLGQVSDVNRVAAQEALEQARQRQRGVAAINYSLPDLL